MIDITPAGAAMITVLRGLRPEHLWSTTVCDDYTVADLVDHVDHVARGSAGFARKDDVGGSQRNRTRW